jgi:hypothetical protein
MRVLRPWRSLPKSQKASWSRCAFRATCMTILGFWRGTRCSAHRKMTLAEYVLTQRLEQMEHEKYHERKIKK